MIHVRYATGSDGPTGWPSECCESESADLMPGYDAVMTAEELQALKISLESQYAEWHAAQNFLAKAQVAIETARLQSVGSELASTEVTPSAVRLALRAVCTLANDEFEALGRGRPLLEDKITVAIGQLLMSGGANP